MHFHPLVESFSAAVLEAVTTTLAAEGHDVTIHRLHEGDSPGATDLQTTEALVLVYPTWWGGQPAALLEWLQQRLAPWIDGAASEPSPIRTVRHLIAVTTHGSSRLINRLQGEPGRQLLQRVVAGLCAPGVDMRWISLYTIDRSEPADRQAFVERVRREVSLRSPAA